MLAISMDKIKENKGLMSFSPNIILFFLLSCMTVWIYLSQPAYLGYIKLPLLVMKLLFVLLLGAYALMNSTKIYISIPVVIIYSLFVGLNYFYYIEYADKWAESSLINYITYLICYIMMSTFFSISYAKNYPVARIFLCIALISIIANYVEYLSTNNIFSHLTARCSGFYGNANLSAEGILLALCCSIHAVPKQWRLPYLYLCLSGVLLTFSKSGIIAWVLIYAYLLWQDIIPRKKGIFLLFFLIFLYSDLMLWLGAHTNNTRTYQVEQRALILDKQFIHNSLEDHRIGFAKHAISLFGGHPFLGNGSYALLRAGSNFLSHNQYLEMLTNYGMVGLIFYLMLLSFVFNKQNETRVLLLFILFWGFFSHNILDTYGRMAIVLSLVCVQNKAATISSKEKMCAA